MCMNPSIFVWGSIVLFALQLFLWRISEVSCLIVFALKRLHIYLLSPVWKLCQIIFINCRPRHKEMYLISQGSSPEFFPISSCLWLFLSALDYGILALNRVCSRVWAWDFNALVHEVFVFSQRAAWTTLHSFVKTLWHFSVGFIPIWRLE